MPPAADGVQALSMNSLGSAWTPVLAGLSDPEMQTKGDFRRSSRPARYSELYSLSDWYKTSVSSSRKKKALELTCPLVPSNIVAEFNTALLCRFAFI